MKKLSAFIMVLMFLVIAPNVRAAVSLFAPDNPIKISIAIPVESLNIDDLDVRDEFNRPLRSTSAKSNFASLWMQSLNQRLLLSLTPIRLKMLDLLNSRWDGFAALFSTSKRQAIRAIKIWFDLRKTSLNSFFLVSSSYVVPTPSRLFTDTNGNAFIFLLHAMITSTQILR